VRSHRRRLPIEHALIAGDATDLPAIVAALVWLSPDTYGQVLVEMGPDEELPLLAAPLRVSVHRVERSAAGHGVAAGRAVAAWVEEWMPGEPDERRAVTVWVGERVDVSCPEITGLVERL
jgi:NADPH-dependent ferric siderophore reductase